MKSQTDNMFFTFLQIILRFNKDVRKPLVLKDLLKGVRFQK